MNEQAYAVRVGELATAVGYPLPSIRWVENAELWAVLGPQGVAAPVLQLDRRVSQWCAALFDLVVAEGLQRAAFGMHRHHRILRVGYFFLGAGSAVAVGRLSGLPLAPGIAVALAVTVLTVLLISATMRAGCTGGSTPGCARFSAPRRCARGWSTCGGR
ncbi:hypothetical protein [Kribbella albertanoniae]|uniref:Uncharacterized protein n=1 Tax=Kribbella albertanoniae TaxID=1266829 RepID=A0A4R4QA72_9ACTN|nr:hypothetical protein [Kribbella albertanoniae]TDC32197.1 hypothetical protein E1261_09160 [Kribbella albertanoniae]